MRVLVAFSLLLVFAMGTKWLSKANVPGSRSIAKASSLLLVEERNAEAFERQRAAANLLLRSMRAEPDAWRQPGCIHGPTQALWIDPFRDFFRCPHAVEKVGKLSDGGKWVCGVDTLLQKPGCVVYSFGSNGETSFEKAILERTACSVWTFDPTLDEAAATEVNNVPGLNFAAVGLSDKDGAQVIQGAERQVRTLRTLMRERGHEWVDLIKMDVEGAEWPVFQNLIAEGTRLPVTQMQVEMHLMPQHTDLKPFEVLDIMEGVQLLGMRVFHVEENNYCHECAGCLYEVAFANVDSSGHLVAG